MGVTAEILSPRAHWKKLCASCTCGNPWAAFTWEVSYGTHGAFHLPAISNLEVLHWKLSLVWRLNPMTYQTPPISYKVATTSMLFCFFFHMVWWQKPPDVPNQHIIICAEIFLGLSFWWNEPYRYSLSCFIPHISIAYSAFESLELLKHNLEAWDHTYSWLLNSSLRGIINNKIHCNSMQNKTNNIFLMSKQKNKVSVHLVPSEFSLLFYSQLVNKTGCSSPFSQRQASMQCRDTDIPVHRHVLGVGRKDRQ